MQILLSNARRGEFYATCGILLQTILDLSSLSLSGHSRRFIE